MLKYIKLSFKLVLMSLTLLSFTACTEELQPFDSTVQGQENMFTFSIKPESVALASRSSFSDGSKVNRIYYAIFKENDKKPGEYEIDRFYHPENAATRETENEVLYKELPYELEEHSKDFLVRLLPDPDAKEGQKYKILCWAQYTVEDKGKFVSPYYDISKFPKVTMKSGQGVIITNNDEYRDAFFAMKDFTTADLGSNVRVTLTRPFAQINIGTSGWDYEGLASIEPDLHIIKFSKIKITGVANTLNILKSEAIDSKSQNDERLELTYEYDNIPAYSHLDFEELKKIIGKKVEDHGENGIFTNSNKDEEFLLVKLTRPEKSPAEGEDEEDKEVTKTASEEDESGEGDGNEETKPSKPKDEFDDGFADYIGWKAYDDFCAKSKDREELLRNIYTETFKYLSMCYVLVPFTTDQYGIRTGSTVDIVFDCAEAIIGGDAEGHIKADGIFGPGKPVLDLKNVPVGSNYRTNIIPSDGTGFFMNSNEINVAINREPFADYYKRLGATEKDWDDVTQGEIGENLNDDFEWSKDDIDPETGKYWLVLPGINNYKVKFNGKEHDAGNKKDNYIDVYRYSDEEVTLFIDFYAGINKYINNDKYFNKENASFEYYIGDTKIDENRFKDVRDVNDKVIEGLKSLTLTISELDTYKNNFAPVVTVLEEYETVYNTSGYPEFTDDKKTKLKEQRNTSVPELRYYPIELRIVTSFKEKDDKFRPKDYVTYIRLHTAYKFTFSSTSTDEGGELWNDLISKGTLSIDVNGPSVDEKGCYFIDDRKAASSKVGRVLAESRKNTGGNNSLYAMRIPGIPDHIKFRGGAYQNNNRYGHFLYLNGIRESCKLTYKIGRDKYMDNSGSGSGTKAGYEFVGGTPNNWYAHVNWGQCDENTLKDIKDGGDLVLNWKLYETTKDNKDNNFIQSYEKKSVLNNYETKILQINKMTISSTVNVNIYPTGSACSNYWVILSEPDN